jgi:nitroreductase
MNIFDTVKTMLAVRSYRREPIPVDLVTRVVEAGRLTGSSRNRQGWDFVVIQEPQTLTRIGALASSGSFIAGAPLAIAIVVPEGPTGYIDGARAAQDMMLVAWGEGVGSTWVGNVSTEPIKALLNVPQDQMILTIIPFGYPTKPIGKGIKKRKSLVEVAHAEKFGQPYSAGK